MTERLTEQPLLIAGREVTVTQQTVMVNGEQMIHVTAKADKIALDQIYLTQTVMALSQIMTDCDYVRVVSKDGNSITVEYQPITANAGV